MSSGRVVKTPVLYMKKISSDGVEGTLTTVHQNYCTQLCKLDEGETNNINIAAVRARLGGEFDHTSELKLMKFKEAMSGLNSNK